MAPGPLKKTLIFLMLGLLTAAAFFIRLENFKNGRWRTTDEIVYFRMAQQVLQEGLAGYNTVPYGKELSQRGRELPDYFFRPLFKHPPLFTVLVALSMRVFGETKVSASYVPILASVLMIPLVYVLGTLLFSWQVGVFAAFFLSIDPISIICSQKIWMETLLAFFSICSFVLFVKALKSGKNLYLYLGGIACGLAALTKYPGILLVFIYLIYAYWHEKPLMKNKHFYFSMAVPFLMLAPWGAWNYAVYGNDLFSTQINLHSSRLHQEETIFKLSAVIFILVLFRIQHLWLRDRGFLERKEIVGAAQNKRQVILGLIVLAVLFRHIWRGLCFTCLPTTSWGQISYYAPPTFYFGQLLEFSMVYIFAYVAFLADDRKSGKNEHLLKIAVGVLMIYYTLWGNYQSRYILACIPPMIILASHVLVKLIERSSRIGPAIVRHAVLTLVILIIGYILIKTNYINQLISFPNDLCYF